MKLVRENLRNMQKMAFFPLQRYVYSNFMFQYWRGITSASVPGNVAGRHLNRCVNTVPDSFSLETTCYEIWG